MTKTLYDPEVERRGIEQGIEKGVKQEKIEMAKKMIDKGLNIQDIIELTGLTREELELFIMDKI